MSNAPIAPVASLQARTWWFTGFIMLLVLLPLPFGGNRPWASDLFAMICAVLVIGLAWDLYRAKELWPPGAPLRRVGTSGLLMSLVALWAYIQTQGWTPDSWHHPLWQSVQTLPNAGSAISIDPDRFAESLARLLAYVACFLLAFFAGRDSGRALTLVKALAFTAVGYAFYGIVIQSTGANTILWYDKWAYRDLLSSTFVNKNSYATYAGLGLQCCVAMLWHRLKSRPTDAVVSRHSMIAAQLERFARKDIFYIIMTLLVLAALVFTGSRAGVASSGAGCFALVLMLAVNRRWNWSRWAPLLGVGAVFLLSFMMLGNMATANRLNEVQLESDAAARLAAYNIASDAIAENPGLGFGMGTFENAFRLFRNPTLDLWFQHAHNDYLEVTLELGVPAMAMILLSIAILLTCCAVGVWRRKRQEIFCVLAISATVTVGLHALADFSMQIPAVAATYAALLGVGVAQSWSTRDGKTRS